MKDIISYCNDLHAQKLFEHVRSQTKPEAKDLKYILSSHQAPFDEPEQLKAVKLKYQAVIHEPTTIEMTMTPEQLYEVDCPLWATPYSIDALTEYFKLDLQYPTNVIIEYLSNIMFANQHHLYMPPNILKPAKILSEADCESFNGR